ncbi:MAG: hypothetical protein B7Z72_02960 [Gemmatimonadetes bacterium 21-71-4]|nr:MAG: hypothetical protein B7Z72_02960 [Gemmatimonadetes bacterium 21-71-4]
MGEPGSSDHSARARIVSSARRSVLERGEGGANSAHVAAYAGVSKALVHYHFTDKRTLLVAVVDECTAHVERRYRLVAAPPGDASAFDRCREWLAGELDARDLELLVRLAADEDHTVSAQARAGLRKFQAAVEHQLAGALRGLGLAPAIRMELVATLASSTVLGLAASNGPDADADREAILDTLWLAILSLAR